MRKYSVWRSDRLTDSTAWEVYVLKPLVRNQAFFLKGENQKLGCNKQSVAAQAVQEGFFPLVIRRLLSIQQTLGPPPGLTQFQVLARAWNWVLTSTRHQLSGWRDRRINPHSLMRPEGSGAIRKQEGHCEHKKPVVGAGRTRKQVLCRRRPFHLTGKGNRAIQALLPYYLRVHKTNVGSNYYEGYF